MKCHLTLKRSFKGRYGVRRPRLRFHYFNVKRNHSDPIRLNKISKILEINLWRKLFGLFVSQN